MSIYSFYHLLFWLSYRAFIDVTTWYNLFYSGGFWLLCFDLVFYSLVTSLHHPVSHSWLSTIYFKLSPGKMSEWIKVLVVQLEELSSILGNHSESILFCSPKFFSNSTYSPTYTFREIIHVKINVKDKNILDIVLLILFLIFI